MDRVCISGVIVSEVVLYLLGSSVLYYSNVRMTISSIILLSDTDISVWPCHCDKSATPLGIQLLKSFNSANPLAPYP